MITKFNLFENKNFKAKYVGKWAVLKNKYDAFYIGDIENGLGFFSDSYYKYLKIKIIDVKIKGDITFIKCRLNHNPYNSPDLWANADNFFIMDAKENLKYNKELKRKKEELRIKHKYIDPYEEEDWDD